MSFFADVKEKAEGGQRSVQPLGGDGQHVEVANTPEASAPRKGENVSIRNAQLAGAMNRRSSQGIGSGTSHAGDLEAPGKSKVA